MSSSCSYRTSKQIHRALEIHSEIQLCGLRYELKIRSEKLDESVVPTTDRMYSMSSSNHGHPGTSVWHVVLEDDLTTLAVSGIHLARGPSGDQLQLPVSVQIVRHQTQREVLGLQNTTTYSCYTRTNKH